MSKGEITRAAILEQAVQLASVRGLYGLTIGSLAQHTGLSKGGICAHFVSKQALQFAVIEYAAAIFQRAVVAPALTSRAGLPRLQQLSEAWMNYLQEQVFAGGCFFTNVVLEVDDQDDQDIRERAAHHYQQFLTLLRGECDAARRQGHFRASVESDQFAFAFIGILLGAVLWRSLGRLDEGIALARRSISDLLEHAQA